MSDHPATLDGPLKVRGAATYDSDVTCSGLVHAALVQSTVAAGAIRRIDVTRAKAAAGVLAVMTHMNAPALADPPDIPFFPSARYAFKDNRILHHGQAIGVVVAESQAQAVAAARLVDVDYDATAPNAEVVYGETFHTHTETNNPTGLFATVAVWEKSGRLTVHDATQWPLHVRDTLAAMFGLASEKVRVLAPYVGGGFGAGLRVWPHVVLTALVAREVGRPVKIVLSRPQMFNSVGNRPETASSTATV